MPAAPAELQAVAIEASVPQIDEADAALAAADADHASAEPVYIGRHAAGPHPAPRQASNVPPIRPRERVQAPVESLLYA